MGQGEGGWSEERKRGRDFISAGLMVTEGGGAKRGVKTGTEDLHQNLGRVWQPHRNQKNMEEKSEVNYLYALAKMALIS